MKYFFFYLLTVLIWGSTWIGIKMQLGVVAPMVSVGYRFGIAALILIFWCKIKGLSLAFSAKEHGFIALQGVTLFCLNYLLFYYAEIELTSGLPAVIFSTVLLMNVINGRLFLKSAIDYRVISGGVLGLSGIILVFRQDITSFSLGNGSFNAVLLCIVATYLASLGNILSARNQKNGLPIIQTNALGMTYGAFLMLLLALFTGKEFTIDMSLVYLGSLFYLAVFGSIIAFGCYLTLLGSIGADRAAYATLLFPIVALAISTFWENYHWTGEAMLGVFLILAGNLQMLKKRRKTRPGDNANQNIPISANQSKADNRLEQTT